MFRRCLPRRELQTGINVGRAQLAQQFAAMDGWQSQQDSRFDAYVTEKRQKDYFDAFDQRVERAYRSAARLHKAEIVNTFKRRLTSAETTTNRPNPATGSNINKTAGKFTAQTMIEMRAAVEERLRWLRDVWSTIDADYRSGDPPREAAAAREISAALQGEPGEYMKWLYDSKREGRFLGPAGKAAQAAELEDSTELPEVSDEEVNRYHSLAIDMLEVERQVKAKYGIAGQQHWAELQAAKDAVYEAKLDRAADIYHQLIAQSERYEESRRTALLRSNVERKHQAQVRFKAAMELESERERMIEAHTGMESERKAAEKAQRITLLNEAAALKASGASSEEIRGVMRERQLSEHARRQSEYQLREQESIRRQKSTYIDLIDRFKSDVEEREGRELLSGGRGHGGHRGGGGDGYSDGSGGDGGLRPQRSMTTRSPGMSAFGFADDDRLEGDSSYHPAMEGQRELDQEDGLSSHGHAGDMIGTVCSRSVSRPTAEVSPHAASKAQLWRDIAADNYEDPFHTLHQARLDAATNYDATYEKFFPMSTIQGRKYTRQNMGERAAGTATENQILQRANMNVPSLRWGVNPHAVMDLDGDGATNYFTHTSWHVQDKATGDVDFRYERKKGGAVFRGPRFYNIGAARDAADPGERTVDPMPHQASPPKNLRGGGGGGVGGGRTSNISPPMSISRGSAASPPRRNVRLSRLSTPPPAAGQGSGNSGGGDTLDWRSN